MAEEYDTNAFMVFVVAILSMYVLFASIFLIKRIRRVIKKEPIKKEKKRQLVEVEEEVVENPLTTAFWINAVLVAISLVVIIRLTLLTSSEEPEVFDPYATLGISVGASDRAIKSAYRRMAKIYHPDKPTGSVEKFRDIEKAYRILTDEIAKSNYERYGNPDGPSAVKVGIALPEWMSEKSGSRLVVIGYLLLMVVGIPLLVYCLKSRSSKQEKPKIKQETIGAYYHAMNESTPLQNVPEIFSMAEELLEVMRPKAYDDLLLNYLNVMCPKNNFASSKMRRPRVPLEKAKEDAKIAAWLKTNILVHAYLNNLEVAPPHKEDQLVILSKAPELLREMMGLAMVPRIRGKLPSLTLVTTVIHFQQCMYQGLWVEDSPLKQLPYFEDREVNSNKCRNRAAELKEFMLKDPSKWKGLQHLLKEQVEEVEEAVHHLPQLEVGAHMEVEEEEDIFVGDRVTCVLKVVHKNWLPEGMTVEEALKGKEEESEESEESEEEEKEEKEEKQAMSMEELNGMHESMVPSEREIVLSKHYPFRIHEHWVIVLSDREDKNALDAVVLTPREMVEELRAFPMIPDKEGLMTFHLHFLCPAYVGLDFTVPVSMRVLPESEKPKVEINKKDLELDKEKGLMDMLNVEEEDGWESSDEESEEEKEEEVKEEEAKPMTKKERQRLYHQKKVQEARKAKEIEMKSE